MDEVLGPDDHDRYEEARDRLIAAFAGWGGEGLEPVAEQALDFRWG